MIWIFDVRVVGLDGRRVVTGQGNMGEQHWNQQGREEDRQAFKHHKSDHVGDLQIGLPHVAIEAKNLSQHQEELWEGRENADEGANAAIHHQLKEEFVVPQAHAVVDPRAVVVHAQHAKATHIAMMSSLWPRDAALSAVCRLSRSPSCGRRNHWQGRANIFHKFVPAKRYLARLGGISSNVGDQSHCPNGVEEKEEERNVICLANSRQHT
mmetsp:Transcript_62817/g.137607  ORF Transcript_62817/g.137607 Transcript_62817/m.137607 type:complete len:210 (+) Transcript_62817:408-1037(+)